MINVTYGIVYYSIFYGKANAKLNMYNSFVSMCLVSSEIRWYDLKTVECSSIIYVCGVKLYTVKEVLFIILVP